MPWSGGGTFTRSNGTFTGATVWQQDKAVPHKIKADRHDTHDQDLAAGINAALAKNGENAATANLPMGGFRHTGVANATARDNYAAVGQVQDGSFNWCGDSGGTADAITLSPTPVITAYAAGQRFHFKAATTNTGATTVSVSALATKAVQNDGSALVAGDITTGKWYTIEYDGAAFQIMRWRLGVTAAGAEWAWTGDISPAQITADQNDYNPSGLSTATVLRLDADAPRSITGLQGGADGRLIVLRNIGSWPITIKNEDTGSSAANRFGIGGHVTLRTREELWLLYDGTLSRWANSGRSAIDRPTNFANSLVNGGMEVWQRGTSVAIAASSSTTALVYSTDRWAMHTGANQACVIAQQTGLTDQSRYAARVQRNSGQTGTGVLRFEQAFDLDDIVPLRGRIVTLQFTARKGTNYSATSDALAVALYCGTGAAARRGAGAYTGETTPISTSVTLTATAKGFSATATVVVPTTTTQLSVAFEFTPTGTAGTDDWFEIDDVQLEAAAVASPFERRPMTIEEAMCQRFYWRSQTNEITSNILGNSFNTNTIYLPLEHPTRMRSAPTQGHNVTGYGTGANQVDCTALTTGAKVTITGALTVGSTGPSQRGVTITLTAGTSFSPSAGAGVLFHTYSGVYFDWTSEI